MESLFHENFSSSSLQPEGTVPISIVTRKQVGSPESRPVRTRTVRKPVGTGAQWVRPYSVACVSKLNQQDEIAEDSLRSSIVASVPRGHLGPHATTPKAVLNSDAATIHTDLAGPGEARRSSVSWPKRKPVPRLESGPTPSEATTNSATNDLEIEMPLRESEVELESKYVMLLSQQFPLPMPNLSQVDISYDRR